MKRKKWTIAIDMDGVLADTVSQFISWYHRDFGIAIEREVFNGKPEAEGLPDGHVRKYVYTKGFFRDLPVMEGAQEAVQELMKDFEVYVVSAAVEFPLSLFEKHEWLKEHFPFISWRNIVFCGDKSIIDTDFRIDDHVHNLDNCKGKTFLYTAGHNLGIDRHTRVNSWQEILSLLKKELEAA